jgi:sortase B
LSKKNKPGKQKSQAPLWVGAALVAAYGVYKNYKDQRDQQGDIDDLLAPGEKFFTLPPVDSEEQTVWDKELVQITELEIDPEVELLMAEEAVQIIEPEIEPEVEQLPEEVEGRTLQAARKEARARSRGRKKGIYTFLLLVFICTAAFSGYKLYEYMRASQAETQLGEELRAEYRQPKPSVAMKDRFEGLRAVNEDIVGWIQVTGSKVDYPVLQARNNDYYLRRNALKEYAIHGSIFMDATSDASANKLQTVIYGHNMKDGSMFGSLSQLKKIEAFEKNPQVIYEYPGGKSTWDIFSVYIYKGGDRFFEFEFASQAEFGRYVQECAERNMHGAQELSEIPARILTLVTCTYEFDNSRLIVHAKPADL